MSFFKIRYGLIAAICMLGQFCIAPGFAYGQGPLFISFQVPDSMATYPQSINALMVVTGYYINNSGATRGFVRSDDGAISTFDVPGGVSTQPAAINTAGDVTGFFTVPSSVFSFLPDVPQGFVRTADGTITTFGNGLSPYNLSSFWAQPVAINAAGEIIGNFPATSLTSWVFVRSASGAVQTFSLSQGGSYPTVATGLNAAGAVVGYSNLGSQGLAQGFLWPGSGSVPYSGSNSTIPIMVAGSKATYPTSINGDGAIAGCYVTSDAYFDSSFLRDPDGTITTFRVPGNPICGPSPIINDAGTIVGSYINTNVTSGFIKPLHSDLVSFTYPGATVTMPTGVNSLDVITGYYSIGPQTQGFIRIPAAPAD